MLAPDPITTTTLLLGALGSGLGGVSVGVIGNLTDRTFCDVARGLRDRFAGLSRLPDGDDTAVTVRTAQMQALERVIRDYRDSLGRPESLRWMEPKPTQQFFQLSLAFCAQNVGRHYRVSVGKNPELTQPLLDSINDIFAPPAHDGSAYHRAKAVTALAEDAVLAELLTALDGVPFPRGFEEYFRTGTSRFSDLFGAYVSEQIQRNERFRAIFTARQLSEVTSIATAAKEAAESVLMQHLPPTAHAVWDYLLATGSTPITPGAIVTAGDDGSTDLLLRHPSGTTIHFGCVEGVPTKYDVDRLRQRANSRTATEVRLLTSEQIPDGLSKYASDRGITLQSLRDLVFEVLELEQYVTDCDRIIGEHLEAHWFVAPRYSTVNPDLADPVNRTIRTDLHEHLSDWARKPERVQIAMLGDYGSGKSTVALLWVKHLLDTFGRLPNDRLPLLIRAADCHAIKKFENIFASCFRKKYQGRLGEQTVFDALSTAGRLLIVFDGLDELGGPSGADPDRGITRLAKGIHGDVKLMLTCRANYFETLEEEIDLLGEPGLARGLPVFRGLRLEPFDMPQVIEYIRHRVSPDKAAHVQKVIFNTYDLPDLSTRPVLLNMILSNWDRIEQEADPTRAIEVGDLYRLYTDQWFEGASDGRHGSLSKEDRVDLMVAIAVWMAETGNQEMAVSALPDRMREGLHKGIHGRDHDYDGVEREVRSQTFLVRNAQDQYHFAHRSFQEFFLALEIVREIESETLTFLTKQTLQPEVVDFTSVHHVDPERVWQLLDAARRESTSAILNGNLLSILRDQGADFSGRDLSELHAEGANLRGTRFVGTNLSNSRLHRCDLRDADFSGARLTGATLTRLILGVRSPAKCVRFRPGTSQVLASDGVSGVRLLSMSQATHASTVHSHNDSVTCIAVSGDGRIVASGGFDGRVRVTDLQDSRTWSITSHGAIVYGVAIRRDGRYVASTDSTGRLKIWDLHTGQLVGDWLEHGETAYSVDWSPRGDAIATGSFDKTVCLWRFSTEGNLHLLARPKYLVEHESLVNGVRFSPCGTYIAAASNNGSVRVWEVETGREIAMLPAQREPGDIEWAVSFAPHGNILASAGSDGTIRLWDWRTGTVQASWQAHDSEIWTLDYDSTGEFLASGSLDGSVRVWRVKDGSTVDRWDFPASDHGLRMHGADCTNVQGLSGLQKRVLSTLGARV